MKKIWTKAISLMTAALTIGACTINASAESAYQLGDVDMNGYVNAEDANKVLCEYLVTEVMEMPATFTEEQVALGNVYHPDKVNEKLDTMDANYILVYFLIRDVMEDPDCPALEEFVKVPLEKWAGGNLK